MLGWQLRRVVDGIDGPVKSTPMFFWFKRREDLLRYEARQLSSGEFEFCVIDEHGKETVETFPDGDALHARQLDFERRIKDEGWSGPHGWNL
jgi:hypothetical protein